MLIGFIALPFGLRVLLVFVASILAARFTNWAIYSWAHFSRSLGPWSNPATSPGGGAGQRTWQDHLPGLGWWLLRRESHVHGAYYWVRPLLLELLLPVASVAYYVFLTEGGTLPAPIGMVLRALQPELHGQYLGHFVLFFLMAIATFIDFDEQSIPDHITIPGTIIGLLGAATIPGWMGQLVTITAAGPIVQELDAAAPNPWLTWLNGPWGLYWAIIIILTWTFALLDRRIILRRGLPKAFQYFFAGIFRHPYLWKIVVASGTLILIGVILAWNWHIVRWQYLLSSLFGLACAGGITWAVRISASLALGTQALGFGDVTLMAMIGTYAGWQASILVFFMAPLMAVQIVLLQYLITGERAAPFGPYLCAATVAVFVFWDRIWNWGMPMFALSTQILFILAACVVAMGALLWIWRLLKGLLWAETR